MHDMLLVTSDEELVELPDADASCTAELAECTCPDFCERDHDNE